jgi:tetratricopeptide (TPR) repeat protein
MEINVKRLHYLGIILLSLAMGSSRCLGQKPTTLDDQSKAAFALEQQGNDAEAEAAWRAILKAHPASAEAYANLGLLEARQQRYAQAAPLYRKALALNPAMPGLQLNLGLSLFKSGDLKGAIQVFTPLLKREPPTSPEALRLNTLIGLAHYGLGDYSAAVPYLKRATASNPQNLPFRLALAQSCLRSKQYQCVLDVYHEILDLNEESAEADMLAGEALDEMNNDAGALQQFRAAVKADPRMPNVHFGLGYLLWRMKQFDEAAQEFNAELANNPDDANALTYLADTDMHLNLPEAATPLLEHAIRIDPGLEVAHLDLGILYGNAARPNDALRELKLAEKLSPMDGHVHWRLARFYQAAGRKEEAKAEFAKTRNIDNAATAHATLLNQLHEASVKTKPAEEPPLN